MVTITGTNFNTPVVNDVEFDNHNAGTFTVVNDTTITATVPNNGTDGPIQVTNADGTATSSTDFNVIRARADDHILHSDQRSDRDLGHDHRNELQRHGLHDDVREVQRGDGNLHGQLGDTDHGHRPTAATIGPISLTTPGGTATRPPTSRWLRSMLDP